MDTLNYLLFKNPVISHSVETVKYIIAASGYQTVCKSSSSSKIITDKEQICKMLQEVRPYVRIAAAFGAAAVILGAYGAHVNNEREGNENRKQIFETANRYHFYHTLALLAAPFCRYPNLTTAMLVSGMLIFSGTCYYESITGDPSYRKYTPMGGSLLILSWITMIL